MKNTVDSMYIIVNILTGIIFLGIIIYPFSIREGLVIGNQLSIPNGLSSISGPAFRNQMIPPDETISPREIERLLQIERSIEDLNNNKNFPYSIRDPNGPSKLDFDNPPTEESLKKGFNNTNTTNTKYKIGSSLKNQSETAKNELQDSKDSHEKDAKSFGGAQRTVVKGSGIRNGNANELLP